MASIPNPKHELDVEGKRPRNAHDRSTPRSQALIYEIQLKEVFDETGRSPAKERVQCCFRILEDLIPMAGAFSSILTLIKEELRRSIFSKGLTSSGQSPYVERIPFFDLVERIDEARDHENAKTKDQIDEYQHKIKFRDHDLQLLYKKNLALKQEISDHEAAQQKLRDDIARLEEEIQKQERDKAEVRGTLGRQEEDLKKQLESTQTQLSHSNHVIEKLTLFKTVYNESGEVRRFDDTTGTAKNEIVIDSEGMLSYDLQQAEQLEKQFAEILDFQLDDFEATLAQLKKKQEILEGVASTEGKSIESVQKEMELLEAGFKKRMLRLLGEMQLLKEHIQGLKHIHQKNKEDKLVKTTERFSDFSLRKYATVMFVSTDGKSFDTFEGCRYCSKCGAKVIACPHQALKGDKIALPLNATHIRVAHPPLRLKTWMDFSEITSLIRKRLETEEEANQEETEDEQVDVLKLQGFKPMLNRAYPLPKLVTFVQEIYDLRWTLEERFDEVGKSDDTLPRFADFFYDLILERYQIPEIALKAIHDILVALQQNDTQNQNLSLFVLHLSGQEDVLWKYLHMARRLYQSRSDPMDMSKYRQVIQIMYPNRTREVYDQMELEYTAFCKNKVSKESMEDHLVHLMSTGIEPNYLFFLKCLQKFDYQKKGHLSYEDFDEAITQILPSASTRERQLRFKLTELDFKKEGIPIERLAYIASYLVLYSCYKAKWALQSLISPDYAENMTEHLAGMTLEKPFRRPPARQ